MEVKNMVRMRLLSLIMMIILLFSMGIPMVSAEENEKKDFIKWIDFNPNTKVLEKCLAIDIETHDSEHPIHWIELLAYLAAKNGNKFAPFKDKDLQDVVEKLKKGERMEDLTATMKHYSYYLEAYTAILGEFVGHYQIQAIVDGQVVWQEKYGLKVFSPIAKNYGFSHYDDFGAGRSYGYRRKHLGHDMMGAIGTPIIAVESGVVETMGWNQYGGWRVGIRSLDTKRYYYYAHLRKNRPYHCDLKEGELVKAGDVIGYLGRSGYSKTENTNNITKNHLHFGLQIIFDPSQKEGPSEIWIDVYAITCLLQKNRSEVVRNDETKEYYRKYNFNEEILQGDAQSPSRTEPVVVQNNPSVRVPIIMYHRISRSAAKSKLVIMPVDLENDLRYLQENGYQAVIMQDLIDYVKDGVPLPPKPVMLTFDDGNYSDYKYAYPLLKKYHMKGIISIIGKITDDYSTQVQTNTTYPNLIWEQICEMQKENIIEIQNHSYDLHGAMGSQKKSEESKGAYQERFKSDLEKSQNLIYENTGCTPTTFTYPLGRISEESFEVLWDLGFAATLTCCEGINTIRAGEPESLFRLKRYTRQKQNSMEQILKRAEKFKASINQSDI